MPKQQDRPIFTELTDSKCLDMVPVENLTTWKVLGYSSLVVKFAMHCFSIFTDQEEDSLGTKLLFLQKACIVQAKNQTFANFESNVGNENILDKACLIHVIDRK